MADADDGLLLFDDPAIDENVDPKKTHLDGFVVKDGDQERRINQMPMPTAINVLVGPNNAGKSRLMRQLFIEDWLPVKRRSFESWASSMPNSSEFEWLLQHPVAVTARQMRAINPDSKLHVPGNHWMNDEWPWRIFCPPIRSTLRFSDAVSSIDAASLSGLSTLAYARSHRWTELDIADWAHAFAPGAPTPARMIATGAHLYEQVRVSSHASYAIRQRWRKGCSIVSDVLGLRDAQLIALDSQNDFAGVFVSEPQGDTSIHQLGDGISACLIILLPLLLRPETRGALFIEEPELYLHPGLQRQLAKLLANKDIRGNTTLYMTTHSADFLDAMAEYAGDDLTVLRVEKEEATEAGGKPRHVVRPSKRLDISHLESLGAAAHALLARSLILVEGPSDVRYVRGLMELTEGDNPPEGFVVGHGLVEGRDYAVVTYGGSLLGDLLKSGASEELTPERLLKLNHYLFILADQDEGKEEGHKAIRSVCNGMDGRVHFETTGPAVEFENAFSAEVWKRVLPLLKTRIWAKPKNEFPEPAGMQHTRIETIAKWVYENDLPTDGKSHTLSEGKVKAGEEFMKLVSAKTITASNVGERALEIRGALIAFIKEAMGKSGANGTPRRASS